MDLSALLLTAGLIDFRKEIVLDKGIVERTQKTADLYFKDVKGEKPFDLWRSFDKGLAKDLSLVYYRTDVCPGKNSP